MKGRDDKLQFPAMVKGLTEGKWPAQGRVTAGFSVPGQGRLGLGGAGGLLDLWLKAVGGEQPKGMGWCWGSTVCVGETIRPLGHVTPTCPPTACLTISWMIMGFHFSKKSLQILD